MNIRDIAEPRLWQVQNNSPAKKRGVEKIEIAGWDFGGNGPLALLHHANGLCAAAWALVARRLTQEYRVVAIDARGHGDSSGVFDGLQTPQDFAWDFFVDDLVAVAHHLLADSGEAEIGLGLGSSFGGIVTAAAAAREKSLFSEVVMLDPPIHPSQELIERLKLNMEAPEISRRGDLVAQTLKRKWQWETRDQARTAWQDKALFSVWQDEAFSLYLDEGMRDTDAGVELKCHPSVEAHIFESTGSLSVLDFAPNVQVPVRLVHAQQGFFPEVFCRGLTQLFPQCAYVGLMSDHMLPLQVPNQVVELLLDAEQTTTP